MAFKTANRVREICLSTGAGILNLGGAVDGYQAFSDAQADIQSGDTVYYGLEAGNGQWEVGRGLYLTGPSRIFRVSPFWGSAGPGSAVNFTAAPECFITVLAEHTIAFGAQAHAYLNADQVIAAATATKIEFGNTDFNQASPEGTVQPWNNGTAYAFQPAERGFFRMFAKVDAVATFSGDSYLSVYVAGSEKRRGPTLNGAKSLWVDAEVFIQGDVGQAADFRIMSAGGGTIDGGAALSYCYGRWVRIP